MATKCQFVKKDKRQCVRDVSRKAGHNPSYCWQHQNCRNNEPTLDPPNLDPPNQDPPNQDEPHIPVEPFSVLKGFKVAPECKIDAQDYVKAAFGTKTGPIYVSIQGGMGGFWAVRRKDIDGEIEVYWSYDDQYENPPYKTVTEFTKGYLNLNK